MRARRWSDWGDEDYCYLTTTGRVTGTPHNKYNPCYDGDLAGWRDTALPVAIDRGAP